MKPIRHFEEFIQDGTVKRQAPDASRSASLSKESLRLYGLLKRIVEEWGISEEDASLIAKTAYDVLMSAIRARMASKGLNSSGHGSHEAEVAYLRELGFKEREVQFADQLRYFRNGVLYYGKELEKEYAETVVKFLNGIYPRLKK